MIDGESTPIGKAEKITRFGCGALLGAFVGLDFVARWLIVSVGVAVAVWAVAILACGCLALKYGDEFWYGVFGRNR
jgi:hypothetical protein